MFQRRKNQPLVAACPLPVHPMQSELSPALGGIRLCRAPGCAKPLPQDRRERYCRKAACLQAAKEARLAREAASIKKAADKQAAAEARRAMLKKKLKPAKPVTLPVKDGRPASPRRSVAPIIAPGHGTAPAQL